MSSKLNITLISFSFCVFFVLLFVLNLLYMDCGSVCGVRSFFCWLGKGNWAPFCCLGFRKQNLAVWFG